MLRAFAIKTLIQNPGAKSFRFASQKTMYAGKAIAVGDPIFLFASENDGGRGLVAKGVVTDVAAVPRKPDLERQTPRVSITVELQAVAKRPLGRAELKAFTNWNDGRPQSELNFKFYRQATNKIVGISDEAAAFLGKFF